MNAAMKLYFYEALKNNASLDFIFTYSPVFTATQYHQIKGPYDPVDYCIALSSVKRTYRLAQRIAESVEKDSLAALEISISGPNPEQIRAWTVDQNCTMQLRKTDLVTGIIDFSVPHGTPLESLLLVVRVANDIINIRHKCKNYINLKKYCF
jgi:hypothetical protein